MWQQLLPTLIFLFKKAPHLNKSDELADILYQKKAAYRSSLGNVSASAFLFKIVLGPC